MIENSLKYSNFIYRGSSKGFIQLKTLKTNSEVKVIIIVYAKG